MRSALVPAANLGSNASYFILLLGLIFQSQPLMLVGIVLFSMAVLFTLVTLPVEYNASRRAKQMLLAEGILSTDELPGAEAVLSAAAMTYLASLLVSLVSFLRFLLLVLSAFGRRSSRR